MTHRSALRGVITLIPKAKKDTRKLKNLRPISLLNIDFKLLEKVLANRIKTVIDSIVHTDQKGFMAGRRISVNIRKVIDLIDKTTKENTEYVLVSVDFTKCFDMITFPAIFCALRYFGFGDQFIQMIKTCYTDFTAVVQNNGYFSETINIKQGVRQGGPNSSFLFLLCAEMLAIALRNNQKIEGLPVKHIMNLINQYADDMDVVTKAKRNCLTALFNTLNYFKDQAGFEVNYDKTTVYRMGSLRKSEAKFYTEKELNWTNDPVNVLGISVHHDEKVLICENYGKIVEKSRAIIQTWNKRSLSLLGKIMIINTLIASLFVYPMMVLPTVPQSLVKQMEELFTKFLWDNKKSKISLRTLKSNAECGGAKLVDLPQKDKALKLTWLQILQKDLSMAVIAYENLSPILNHNIWECNIAARDVDLLCPNANAFWKDVLKAWAELNYTEETRNVNNQPIWFNSVIRVQNVPFLWAKCQKNGLMYLGQLIQDNNFISARTAISYGMTLMQYNSLVAAILKKWKEQLKNGYTVKEESNYERWCKKSNISQAAYEMMTFQQDTINKIKTRWEEELKITLTQKEVKKHFANIQQVTNITKYRSFQYRILHRAIVTNIQLHKWNLSDTVNCTKCGRERETLSHLFVQCDKLAEFWIGVEQFMLNYGQEPIVFTVETVLWNKVIPRLAGHIKNLICLVAKQFIYRQRCMQKELNVKEFENHMISIQLAEKYYATKNDKLDKYWRKWYPEKNFEKETCNDYIRNYIKELA